MSNNLIIINAHIVTPVSYTHLDVYKRQDIKAAFEPYYDTTWLQGNYNPSNIYESVSYTHLDVYKRQLWRQFVADPLKLHHRYKAFLPYY